MRDENSCVSISQSSRCSLWRVFQQPNASGFPLLSLALIVLQGHCVEEKDKRVFEEAEKQVESFKRGQKELKDPVFGHLLGTPRCVKDALLHLKSLALEPSSRHPASYELVFVTPIYFLELYESQTIHPAAITEWDKVDLNFMNDLSASLTLSVLEVDTSAEKSIEASEEINRILQTLMGEWKQPHKSNAPTSAAIDQSLQHMQAAADEFASAATSVVRTMPVSSLPAIVGFGLLFQDLRAFIDIRTKSTAADVDSLVKDLLKDFDFRLNEDCEGILEFVREKSLIFKKASQQQEVNELAQLSVVKLQYMNDLAQRELQWLEQKCVEIENSFSVNRTTNNKWAVAKGLVGTAALGAATLATGGAAAAVFLVGGAVALGSSAMDKRSASRCTEVLIKVKELVTQVAQIKTEALARMEGLEITAQRRSSSSPDKPVIF